MLRNKKRCVILVSGGIDSTVLLYELSKNYLLFPIFFDYGQNNKKITLRFAQYHCKKINRKLKVSSIKQSFLNSSITSKKTIKEGITITNLYKTKVKKLSWIEGRNALMLINAMAYSIQVKAEEVFCSFQIDTPEWENIQDSLLEGAKDITPMFIDRINILGELAFSKLIRVRTPFLDSKFDRKDIMKKVKVLGIDINKTYSCRYYPECGSCEQCIIRKKFL